MENRLVTNALVFGGILLSLGLISVSAMLNFRMAYRMGDTELDGWVYGSGAALADGLKALLAFFVWSAWRRREWLAVGAGTLLFVVFTAYSLTAGIGYAAQLRSHAVAVRESKAEAREALVSDIARLESARERPGMQRGRGEIEADIRSVYARVLGKTTVGKYSENCTLARDWSRHSCAEAAELHEELARAEEMEKREAQLVEMRRRLASLGAAGADPQVAALAGILAPLGWSGDRESVKLALLLLVGCLFELGSGLGLYVATVPWRSGVMGATEVPKSASDIGEFVLARLEPRQGEGLSIAALFGEYRSWSRSRGEITLAEGEFGERFARVARQCGLRARRRGRQLVYPNVGVIHTGTAVTVCEHSA